MDGGRNLKEHYFIRLQQSVKFSHHTHLSVPINKKTLKHYFAGRALVYANTIKSRILLVLGAFLYIHNSCVFPASICFRCQYFSTRLQGLKTTSGA